MTTQSQTLRISSSSRRAFLLLACLAPLCAAYNIIERRPGSSDSQRLHPFPKSVQSYACSSLDGPSCRFLQVKDDITSSIASAELDEIVDATLSGGEQRGDSGGATAATNKAHINFKIDGAVSDDTRKAAAQFGTAFLEMINTQLANVADDSLLKAAQAGDADATAQLQKNLQAKLESMMVSAAKEAKSVLSAHERGKTDGATGTGTGTGTGSSSSKSKGKQPKTAQKTGGAGGSKAASSGKKATTAASASGGAKTVAAATASVNAILAELGKIPGQHSAVDLDAIMNRLDGLAKQVTAQSSNAAPKTTKTQGKVNGKGKGKGKGKPAAAPAASARDDEDQWVEDDERADDAAHMDGDDDGYYDDDEDGDEMDVDEDDQGVIYDPDERDKAVLSL